MNIMPRYKELYERALQIEEQSQSPRIKAVHERGLHCKVCLGVTDPLHTKHVFVGLNPGADETTHNPEAPSAQLSMEEYVDPKLQPFRYQKNVRAVIAAFAQSTNVPMEKAIPLFGAVNLSFLHSGDVANHISFNIEVAECEEIIQRELDLPKLQTLIFTGRRCLPLFRQSLWKNNADIIPVEVPRLEIVDPRATVFKTSLLTGQLVTCLFTRHLSPRGPLPATFPAELGRCIAALAKKT